MAKGRRGIRARCDDCQHYFDVPYNFDLDSGGGGGDLAGGANCGPYRDYRVARSARARIVVPGVIHLVASR